MHDILQYMHEDPIHRRWHHNLVTFSALYMHTENFILPFSHDEVVHGKGSLLDKMPGDVWQKYATLRTLYGYMYGHPGKKLLFMGSEFGQWREWNHDRSLDWHLLDDPRARGAAPLRAGSQRALSRRAGAAPSGLRSRGLPLDRLQRQREQRRLDRALRARSPRLRRDGRSTSRRCRAQQYRIGVPEAGWYAELLNSDAAVYGGGNLGNGGGVATEPIAAHGFDQSLRLTIPPLGVSAPEKTVSSPPGPRAFHFAGSSDWFFVSSCLRGCICSTGRCPSVTPARSPSRSSPSRPSPTSSPTRSRCRCCRI